MKKQVKVKCIKSVEPFVEGKVYVAEKNGKDLWIDINEGIYLSVVVFSSSIRELFRIVK